MKILLGIDFSQESGEAAKWAFEHAKKLAANKQSVSLEVAHVMPLSPLRFPTEKPSYENTDTRRRMEAEIHTFLEPFALEGVPYELVFLSGNAAKELQRYAKSTQADWLVVGMSGVGRITRAMIGSTSHSLAHNPPKNLVVVQPESDQGGKNSHFMVALDFSPISERAFESAVSQARQWKATLHLVHVVLPPRPIGLPNGFVSYTGGEIADTKAVEDDAYKELQEFVDSHKDKLKDIEYRALTVTGYPKRELLDYAKEHKVDAIFMGTHGRGVVEAAVLGSVAHGILNQMPCTVVLSAASE